MGAKLATRKTEIVSFLSSDARRYSKFLLFFSLLINKKGNEELISASFISIVLFENGQIF